MNYVATENAPKAIGPYAQAVKVNGLIYTSGQIPMTPDGLACRRDNRRADKPGVRQLESCSRGSRIFI